jgi:hypothetical protein
MKMCQSHWLALKDEVTRAGLMDFVAADGKELFDRVIGPELQGTTPSPANQDPLMACTMMIYGRAIEDGGLYLMTRDPDGNEYCPLCECEKHGGTGWIPSCVKAQKEYMATLKQPPAKPE